MSTPKDVQFRGIDNVLKGYENMDIPSFSIWCGKEMNFKYEGDDMADGLRTLHGYLDLLRSQGSWAIYSLKVYDDVDGKITSKTPYDGSFNFTVNMSPNYMDGVPGGQIGQLNSEISALKKKIEDLEGEEAEENDYGMGWLGKILLHPTVQQLVPVLLAGVTKILKPNTMNGASIAGISGQGDQDNRPEVVRLQDAIDVLRGADPNIVVTLEKLARLAATQPETFKNYITMFNTMNV